VSLDPIKKLSLELAHLPGIGERTALRLALHLLEEKKDRLFSLAESLVDVAKKVKECQSCCNFTAQGDFCSLCDDPKRDSAILCVVSCIQDLMAIESSMSFRGYYHVLHGVLRPMSGIGPKNLRFLQLKLRLKPPHAIEELVLATPATVEGEATALYVKELIGEQKIKLSRIASGVPVGGDLQFADRLSLSRAMNMRQEFS